MGLAFKVKNESMSDAIMVEDIDQEDKGEYKEFTYSPEEESQLVRRLDCFLLITIFWMYLLSYMDRTNVGNAYKSGMDVDLGLSSSDYSIVLIVFFIFYVVFEVPANLVMVRIGAARFVPSIMCAWGVSTGLTALVNSYAQLIGLRVVTAFFEAGFAPSILLILSSWYRKNEQSKRFSAYISAAILSGAFGGLIAGLITQHLHGARGIAGWRWLFIIEGSATVVIGIIGFFTLLPLPQHMKPSRFFTERHIQIAIARLKKDNVESNLGHDITPLNALLRNIKNPQVVMLIIGYMVIVGSSTLSYFYPTLVGGLGYTGFMIQYMTIPIYASAFCCNLTVGYFSDRNIKYRGYTLSVLLLIACVFAIVVVTCYGFKLRYAMLCLMASTLWSSNALALSYASSILSTRDSKTRGVGLALINALGNLAQIYGAYLFPTKDSPKYIKGFGVIAGMCAVGCGTYGILATYKARKSSKSTTTDSPHSEA
ncbi:high-affinity nicotinic acid transporter [[Candida] jaroonii]|uniref:High-affinity nicotinic acid transporter n=1 Tax=[Candida] jaroonii TaxID=467808 RepID=A0ACA9YEM9_9ASCO|nr:high-affinity nicotinic acid transporter [[Candida] jaroonii]